MHPSSHVPDLGGSDKKATIVVLFGGLCASARQQPPDGPDGNSATNGSIQRHCEIGYRNAERRRSGIKDETASDEIPSSRGMAMGLRERHRILRYCVVITITALMPFTAR